MAKRRRLIGIGAAVQSALAASILLVVELAPPAHGRMLLLPLGPTNIERITVERSGLAPIRGGPVRGSMLVEGPGQSIAAALLAQGILMVAAPAVLCGSDAAETKGLTS